MFLPIRDVTLLLGKVTERGKIGYYYIPNKRPFNAYKLVNYDDKYTKTKF